MEAIQDKASGLHTAWMLSILGSKQKVQKKDLVNTSIPELCDELTRISNEQNFRYSSRILHGISIIYKSKVNYFLNDSIYISTRLLSMNKLANFTTMEVNIHTGQIIPQKRTLDNDPGFNIEHDLVPPLPDGDEDVLEERVTRRRLEIQRNDLELFPDISVDGNNSAFNNETSTFALYVSRQSTDEDEGIHGYFERSLDITMNSADFEFNSEGEIIDNGVEEAQEIQDIELDLDLSDPNHHDDNVNRDNAETIMQDFVLEEVAEDPQQGDQHGNGESISNDPNFQISTSNGNQTTSVEQVVLNRTAATRQKQIPKQALRIDEDIKLSNSQMIIMQNEYETRMTTYWKKKKVNSIDSREEALFQQIINERNLNSTAYSTFINRLILPEEIARTAQPPLRRSELLANESMSTMALELGVANRTSFLVEADSEQGREVVRNQEEIAVHHNEDFEVGSDFEEQGDLPPLTNEIFNLSFEVGKSRSSTMTQTTNSDPIFNVSDLQVDHDLNPQLSRFYKYSKMKSLEIGEKFESSTYGLNKLGDTDLPPTSTAEYSKISFADLVPGKDKSITIGETPVKRKHAASSFFSLLALSCKNLVHIEAEPVDEYKVGSASSINVIFPSDEIEDILETNLEGNL
ncbi:rec8 [[Candida] subhashii]|uniref:Rec8 n=1 Tax=[Candida] subhashii TaxID=561895 RepID=A0A8J5QFK1_9ASCO|nr:rec8 [[Candida] subhashii]KAG7660757.1 rec8 [[Candida] subhashii]